MAPLLPQLNEHLLALEQDPTTSIDVRLFESCALALPRQIKQNDSVALITRLANQVPQLQQDPTPAIELLTVLLTPYSFSDVLSIGTDIDFVAGLDVRAVSYNRLLLALLQKASQNTSDAATVAGKPEIAASLVKLWLCTPDAGVAEQSGNVLLGLLRVDQETSSGSKTNGLPTKGQGLFWKRMFQDHDVYGVFYASCSAKTSDISFELTRNQRTLAQARLLEWLPKLGALDWATITKSHNADIESLYISGTESSLLAFAASHMVDTKDDVLMHKCLLEFFADLIATIRQTEGSESLNSSVSLDFLIASGLHAKATAFYLDPGNPEHDPVDLHFLYGSSANYVATYASTYPGHFSESPVKEQTLERLSQRLNISPGRWAHQEPPKRDLHVLASLPRTSLLPRETGSTAWPSSPLSLLPSKSTNPDVLDTLSSVFHGPRRIDTITYPQESPMIDQTDVEGQSEAQAARALYYLYLNHNPRFFADLVTHADAVALTEQALAAIHAITAVITAKWATTTDQHNALTEERLHSWLPTPPTATPTSGVQAILAPPSLEYTLPYLIKPAQSFANIVGGRGDSESAAYKVAVAKFDALKALHDKLDILAQSEREEGYEDILQTLRKRIAQGPFSREGEVGGQIATLDL